MNLSSSFKDKVGVILPTELEYKVFAPRKNFKGVDFLQPGMGKLNGYIAADTFARRGKEVIVLAGYCGGLRGLETGDFVLANSLIEGDYDGGTIDPVLHVIREWPLRAFHGIGDKHVAMVSQDRILGGDPYRHKLGADTIATDMESYGVAVACRRYSTVLLVVAKTVSDIVGAGSEKTFKKNARALADEAVARTRETLSILDNLCG